METLRNEKDVPILISNIEVLHVLSNKIRERKRLATDNGAENGYDNTESSCEQQQERSTRRRDQYQHRDFIEEKVVEYIRLQFDTLNAIPKVTDKVSTKQIHLNNGINGDFEGKNENLPADANVGVHDLNADSNEVTNYLMKMPSLVHSLRGRSRREYKQCTVQRGELNQQNDELDETLPHELYEEEGFGLTGGEIVQILNLIPRESVDLHLIIDELTNRLSEKRQNDLLAKINDVCCCQAVNDIVKHEYVDEDDVYDKNVISNNII